MRSKITLVRALVSKMLRSTYVVSYTGGDTGSPPLLGVRASRDHGSSWPTTRTHNSFQRHYAATLCSVLTGRKHDLTACKFVKNGFTGRILSIRLVSWVPPETFQTLTFTYNDNKDAEYMCFRYCSAGEVRHLSEVRHLHFITILKSFYCPVTAYMYTLPLKEAIPFI